MTDNKITGMQQFPGDTPPSIPIPQIVDDRPPPEQEKVYNAAYINAQLDCENVPPHVTYIRWNLIDERARWLGTDHLKEYLKNGGNPKQYNELRDLYKRIYIETTKKFLVRFEKGIGWPDDATFRQQQ